MTTETIRQIARTKSTFDGTESFEGQDGTGSFQGLIGVARATSAHQVIAGGFYLVNSATIVVSVDGLVGTITENTQNIDVGTDTQQPILATAVVNGGNTTLFDLIGSSTFPSAGDGASPIPVMTEVYIADVITSDIGFYGPAASAPGFDFHITTSEAPVWTPYTNSDGAIQWDAGTGTAITFRAATNTYVFGVGSTDGTALLNDQTGILAAGGMNLAHLPTSDPAVAGELFTVGAPSTGVPKQLWISGG